MDAPHVPSRDRSADWHSDWPAVEVILLDLDGVVTRTATIHAAAWKSVLDPVLDREAAAAGKAFRPWDADTEYRAHVDGKPREEGIRAALAARGITLPEGSAQDPPDTDTIAAIARRKQQAFLALLGAGEIPVDPAAAPLLRRWRGEGRRTAIVTSSRNGRRVLAAAGLDGLVDAVLDGNDSADRSLAGKPAPDTFLAAAAELGATPEQAAVVEDALAGVEAGLQGHFRVVIGVTSTPSAARALRDRGASVVVGGLAELASITLPLHRAEHWTDGRNSHE